MPPGPINAYLAFYPCTIPQSYITEKSVFLHDDLVVDAGIAPNLAEFRTWVSYETENLLTEEMLNSKFGPVIESTQTHSFKPVQVIKVLTFFSRDLLKALIHDDWDDEFFVERLEFNDIKAVILQSMVYQIEVLVQVPVLITQLGKNTIGLTGCHSCIFVSMGNFIASAGRQR